jgi:DNA polymerase-4
MMKMPEPVRLVGVSVSNLRKDAVQLSLFADERRKARVTRALDEVNNKFGEFTMFPAAVLLRSRRQRTIAPSWRPYGIRQAIRR